MFCERAMLGDIMVNKKYLLMAHILKVAKNHKKWKVTCALYTIKIYYSIISLTFFLDIFFLNNRKKEKFTYAERQIFFSLWRMG